MDNIHKYKIPFITKFTALATLLILLNIDAAWGQPGGEQNNTTNIILECGGTTQTYSYNTKGKYIFTNNTGTDITINGITVNTLRCYKTNNNEEKFDYVIINNVDNGNSNDGYSSDPCYTDKNGKQLTYARSVTVNGIEIESEGTATFEIVNEFGDKEKEGCTHAGFSFTITTPSCFPDFPTITSPGIVTSTTAMLDWEDVADATSYSVVITKNGEDYATHTALENSELELNNLTPGIYTWILSFVVDGSTVSSSPHTFSVIACPTLTSPANGATVTTIEPVLTWEETLGATAYNVYIKEASATNYGTSHTVIGTSYAMPYSEYPNGTYNWYVVPMVDGTEVAGLTCAERTFTKNSSLDCVNPNTMTPSGGEEVTSRWLGWDPVPYATGYNVYVSDDRDALMNATPHYVPASDNPEYLIPLMPEGVYYWTVIPVNANLASPTCGWNVVKEFKLRYANADDRDINVSPSTQGREFYFSLMQNGYYNKANVHCGNHQIHEYTAIIAPSQTGYVEFYYYADGSTVTIPVVAGETKSVPLDEDLVYHHDVGSQYMNRTVRVTSEFDISLYIANEACNSFDASVVLPATALGVEYMIQTYPNMNLGTGGSDGTEYRFPCFMIIATENDTRVRIEGDANKIARLLLPTTPVASTNTSRDIILNKGDSYFVRADGNNNVNNLSGIKISVVDRYDGTNSTLQYQKDKCKTIAVFNGNTATSVVNGNKDHLMETAFPISNWGKEFVITPSDGNYGHDYLMITIKDNGTTLQIDGSPYNNGASYNAGETIGPIEYAARNGVAHYITSSKPVACYLYQRHDGNDQIGAPSMVWIAPVERGLTKLTFSTFEATNIDDEDHYVNIVVPVEAVAEGQQITLTPSPYGTNNNNIRSYFLNTNGTYRYVPNSGNKYVYASVQIEHGTYTLESNERDKMVVHVYGLGDVRGYAYNAGCAAVPYRSNLVVGTTNQNGTNYVFDMSALPNDHHFCSGTTYRFSANSNATNVDHIDIYFKYDKGTGGVDQHTINVAGGETYLDKKIERIGEHIVEAHVFSMVYNSELCQETMVEDIIEDKIMAFTSVNRVVEESVCKGTEYHFTESYYKYDADGVLQGPYTYTYPDPSEGNNITVTGTTEFTAAGFSKYGCPVNIDFKVTVYDDLVAGSIEEQTVTCNNSIQITNLLSDSPGSGGDPGAHYQWLYINRAQNIDNIPAPGTSSNDNNRFAPWDSLNNQSANHTVTNTGWYCRAYVSECGIVYTNYIYAETGGVFNPGTYIDDYINVCGNERVNQTIGECPIGVTGTPGSYTWQYGDIVYSIGFEWQESEDNVNWTPIDGEVGCQYTIDGTFPSDRYFRRFITQLGECTLNLNMGVFAVLVKPTFNYTYKVFKGCRDGIKAKIQFTITGGSGNYKVYYRSGATEVVATNMGGGVYEFQQIPANTGNGNVIYNITIKDQTHECEKTESVAVPPVGQITLNNFDIISGCQGTQVIFNLPTITGGTAPYSLNLDADGVGIDNVTITQIPEGTPTPRLTHATTIPTNSNTSTVNYTVTDASGCRTAVIPHNTITVHSNPILTHQLTNINFCNPPDGEIQVTVTNSDKSTGSYKFEMTSSNSSTSKESTVTNPTTTFTGLGQGIYAVEVEDGHGCKALVGGIEIEDPLDIEIGVEVKLGETTLTPGQFNIYNCCPASVLTFTVTSLTDKETSGALSLSDYTYSFNGGEFGTATTATIAMSNTCGDVRVSVRVKSTTGCIEEKEILISVSDNKVPVVEGGQTIEIPTYFCETFAIPELKDLITVTGVGCGVSKVEVAQTGSPANADGEYSVEENLPDGITITVKAFNICGDKESAPATVVVKPIPWPAFMIDGTETTYGENNCYCHGDNIVLTAILGYNGDGSVIPIVDNTYPDATYQWYKVTTDNNGIETETEIAEDNDDNGRYSGYATKELKINSAVAADGDTYRLKITYPNNCTQYADIMICVHEPITFHLE